MKLRITCPGCGVSYCTNNVEEAEKHVLIEECSSCDTPIYQCSSQEVKDAHEKRICDACKNAGKTEKEYTYYACDKDAVLIHKATCEAGHKYCRLTQADDHEAVCTGGHTYCPSEQTADHVAVCQECRETYCPGDETGKSAHALIKNCACGVKVYECSTNEKKEAHKDAIYTCGENGPVCQSELHRAVFVCVCEDEEGTDRGCGGSIYACDPDAESKQAEHLGFQIKCPGCGVIYCTKNEAEAKAHEATLVCEYCSLYSYACAPFSQEEIDAYGLKKCKACTAAKKTDVFYCKEHEKTDPKHHAICPLEEGGCGECYCPISESDKHIQSNVACGTCEKKPCVNLLSHRDLYNLHAVSGSTYTCPYCKRTLTSCTELAEHTTYYCSICGEVHGYCWNPYAILPSISRPQQNALSKEEEPEPKPLPEPGPKPEPKPLPEPGPKPEPKPLAKPEDILPAESKEIQPTEEE